MMFFTNQKLMITVTMVRVSHTGMKMRVMLFAVLDTPVPPLKSDGKKERAANPSMMTVRRKRRRAEDFFLGAVPCEPS
jgi:hypothetical protein